MNSWERCVGLCFRENQIYRTVYLANLGNCIDPQMRVIQAVVLTHITTQLAIIKQIRELHLWFAGRNTAVMLLRKKDGFSGVVVLNIPNGISCEFDQLY